MCATHSSSKKTFLAYFLPRGHLKSSIITIASVLQTVLANPNIRILLTNATEGNACKFLQAIERHCQVNPIIRTLWREKIPDNFNSVRWSAHEMELNRTKVYPEPTIQSMGVGGNLVSRHYDLIVYDDIVNTRNSETPELRRKTYEWYQMTTPLLEPNGRRWMLGTRYHFEDMYDHILKGSGWQTHVRKLKENGEYIFPQKYNAVVEAAIRADMKNDNLFMAQYYNDPVDSDNAEFRQGMIKYYDSLPSSHLCFTTVDLATEGHGHDDSVVLTCCVDSEGKIYVHEYSFGQYSASMVMEIIFQHHERFKPQAIGIETVAFQAIMFKNLLEEAERRNIVLPLVELKPKARPKTARIRALEPRMTPTRPMVFFKEHHQDLIRQLLRFPKGKDDLADALAYQLDIIFPAQEEIKASGPSIYQKRFGNTGY